MCSPDVRINIDVRSPDGGVVDWCNELSACCEAMTSQSMELGCMLTVTQEDAASCRQQLMGFREHGSCP